MNVEQAMAEAEVLDHLAFFKQALIGENIVGAILHHCKLHQMLETFDLNSWKGSCPSPPFSGLEGV